MVGHVGPTAAALISAFAVGASLGRGGSLGEATWWLAVISVGVVVHLALQPAAQRALVLAGLLRMHVEFPSAPPSRWSIAHRRNSPSAVRAQLDEASRSEWTPENQTRRAVLAAALTVIDAQRRDAEVVFRFGDHEVSTQVLWSEIPGFLQLTRFRPDRRRWLLAGVAGAAVAAVLTSAALGNGGSESSTDASRGSTPGTLGLLPPPAASAPVTRPQSSEATAQPAAPVAPPARPGLPPESGSEHTPSVAPSAGVAIGAAGAGQSAVSAVSAMSSSGVPSGSPQPAPTLPGTSGGVMASGAAVVQASPASGDAAGPPNGAAVDQMAAATIATAAPAPGPRSLSPVAHTSALRTLPTTSPVATVDTMTIDTTTREPLAPAQSTVEAHSDVSTCATEGEPYRDEPSADALTSPGESTTAGSDSRASDDDDRGYGARADSRG